MPVRGYKKPTPRDRVINLRVSEEERTLFEKASTKANARNLSDWLRALAQAEAQRMGLVKSGD